MEGNCLIVKFESIKPLICKVSVTISYDLQGKSYNKLSFNILNDPNFRILITIVVSWQGSRDANCRCALFFFVLEITSFTLDLLGKNQMGFLIAQFLLSTLVFGITFYIYFVKKRNIAAGGTTMSVAEKQLIGEEIGCAIVQFVVTFICLILKANYKASVFPLLYSAISVWFAFTRIKEVPDSLPQQQIAEDVDVEAVSRHVDTSSVDSAASRLRHRRNPSDLHESYQKIKSMKEMYLPDLNEMKQKIAIKLQQHDSLPQPPNSEQIEKLKIYKAMMERMIAFLQVSEDNISPAFKDKLGSYEKQIVNFISTNRPRKPSMQQGQLPPPHMHPMQQQQSQIPQVQSHDSQMNPQMQSMNLQSPVATMQQNDMTSLQHSATSSISGSGVSTAQQNMLNSLQPGSNSDSG